MKSLKEAYVDILLISSFGLVPLLWFREGYGAVAGFDFAVYLDPVGTLVRSLRLWSDSMAGGYDTSHEVSSIPYYLAFSLPLLLGFDFYSTEKLVFGLLFAVQGLSVYYMLRALFGGHPCVRTIALSGALYYAFSYPVMAHFGRGNMMALLAYAVMPMAIGLVYRGFSTEGGSARYVLLLSLLSFPAAAAKGHPADFLVLAGVVSSFIVFHAAVSGRQRALKILSFSAWAFAATAIVSVWWVLPNIVYLSDFGLTRGDLVGEGFYNTELLDYYSRGTSLLNVMRNERLDLWFDTPSDEVLNPAIYQSPLFIAIGLLLPAFAFSALALRRLDKNVLYFSVLWATALFLAKGNHAPFGKAFEWMYLNVPGFFFFRAPYRVFSSLIAFSMVPLMAYVTGELRLRAEDTSLRGKFSLRGADTLRLSGPGLRNLSIALLTGSTFLMSFLYAWPLFTGKHLRERGTLREPGVFHNIPLSYREAGDWAAANLKGAKLYYPYEVYDANTKWGYNGPDPSFELIGAPKVASRPGGTVYVRYQRPIESINRAVKGLEYGDLRKVLAMYNVRYAMIDTNLSPWVLPEYNYNDYLRSLFQANGMTLAKKAGPIEFYENPAPLDRVYAAGKGYFLSGDESSLQALSIGGYLDAPLLVMAKDIVKKDFERLLKVLDGIIFYNSNTVDFLCEVLKKETAVGPGGNRYVFNVPAEGTYGVFVKGKKTERLYTFIDTNEASYPAPEIPDGVTWEWAGVARLSPGAHEVVIKPLWARSGWENPAAEVAVIEEGPFRSAEGALSARMMDKSFEVAYLVDDKARKAVEVRLDKGEEYSIAVVTPLRLERSEENAFDEEGYTKDDWRVEAAGGDGYRSAAGGSGARPLTPSNRNMRFVMSRDFLPPVDIGRYPFLVFPDGAEKGYSVIKTELIFSTDVSPWPGERLTITGEEAEKNNYRIDVREELGKNATQATVHRLRRMEVLVEGHVKAATDLKRHFHDKWPGLFGRFGVKEYGCEAGPPVTGAEGAAHAVRNVCDRKEAENLSGPLEKRISAEDGRLLVIKKSHPEDGRVNKTGWVEYGRKSPAEYSVKADSAKKIVFSDSYDGNWTLTGDGRKYYPVKVNGFANGFILDRGTGEFTLEYEPQRIYRYSALISAIALGVVSFVGLRRGMKAGKYGGPGRKG